MHQTRLQVKRTSRFKRKIVNAKIYEDKRDLYCMCYRALFTRSVIMAISAWINQLYSYNLLFARDVMTISNIPLDATTFSVYQILFHYDYSWFYE